MIQYRRCKACKQDRPVSEYSKSPKRIDGLNAKCFACRSADYKDYRKRVPRDKQKQREYARAYKQRREPLTEEQRAARAKYRSDYYQKNKLRLDAEQKEYRDRHPGKNAEQVALYRLRLESNGKFSFSKKDVDKLLSSSCAYCGATGKMSMDHILPVSKGGRNSIGNLLPCCRACNSQKHAKLLIVWRLQKLREGNPVIFETMKCKGESNGQAK
jgi:5-methylcytosine-specific restriction endonuclease McrA